MAAAAAKSRQSCPTLCDPIDSSPPGSPSLEFSRQEHWSGLPFLSPIYTMLMDCSLPGSSVHGIFQARVLGWVAISFSNSWKLKSKSEFTHTQVKLCSKFSKSGFSNKWIMNFQMFKLVLEKAEEPEIKLPTSAGSSKKQESSRKTYISASLTRPKPLTVWITRNCGKFWKRWKYQTTWLAS